MASHLANKKLMLACPQSIPPSQFHRDLDFIYKLNRLSFGVVMAMFPFFSFILGILFKKTHHLPRCCHLYLIFILQHVLTLTALPFEDVFQNRFQCASVCSKFLETFVLEDIFNMPLSSNDSLAAYSNLEPKSFGDLFFYLFKVFRQLLHPSRAQDSPLPLPEHQRACLTCWQSSVHWRNPAVCKNKLPIYTVHFPFLSFYL